MKGIRPKLITGIGLALRDFRPKLEMECIARLVIKIRSAKLALLVVIGIKLA